jgi:hypothetical protein
MGLENVNQQTITFALQRGGANDRRSVFNIICWAL